ncbi:MAG: hypothetical protein E6G17_04135 [Actinobacteria bacterium]|nr:MAG: hypothetical protein E6G17_04135 [Actinomycetota bacterium]
MRRLIAVFAALVAMTAAACGTVGPAAATVNGTHIGQGDFNEELRQIAGNKTYRQSIEQRLPVLGQGRGTVDASFAAQVLTRRILFELVHQEAERRHLKVTATDLGRARQDIVQQVGGQKVFAAFSSTYRKLLTRRFAEVGVVQLAVANVKVDARSVAAYYDQHKDEFTQDCVMHVLVDTKDAADKVRAELGTGADFAQIASTTSKDPSAKQNKGDLGCQSPGNYVAEFANAVSTLPVGELSQPVQTQYGWHVIKVYERKVPPLSEVALQVKQAVEQQGQSAFGDWLQRAIQRAHVSVNPKFGRFDKSQGQPQVVPPQAPARSSNTTAPAPSG